MRGYDRDELHGELEDYDEYEEEGEELEEDPGEGQEEGYEEEDPKPTREELEYLELRQKLKDQIRKQMKRDNGSSKNGSNEMKKKLPYDNYGSFFGNSQPVIAQRVIQESKSLLETNHLASRLSNSFHGNKKDTSTSKGPNLGSRHQLPKVKTELKTKVQKLKDTRDYSFLLSEDAELPASSKEPPPRNVSFPNRGHEARAAHVPMKKSKEPSGSSGRHEGRKTVSMNGQFNSKAGSKLTSASKTADSRKQLGSNFGNGPGRPVGPKGLPLKNPVATTDKKAAVEKKVSAPAAKHMGAKEQKLLSYLASQAMAAPPPNPVPVAYQAGTSLAVPPWLNKGDNGWQMIAATLVGLQSVPGLVILYGSIVKKKWAVNSAFMALYAFASVVICWVTWGYKMSFGHKLLPFWGKGGPALGQKFLLEWTTLPETTQYFGNGEVETPMARPYFPMATMVWFQCVFAAITIVILAGSLLARMNIKAWMMFVPLWLTFSYTVGAFSLWGGGFLFHWGVIDYSGGYVIHLSSGIAGFTAAYWVGPRSRNDRERFPPNNVLLMLAGAGLLWMGWAGFNGGDPYAANIDSSMAVLNTNICAATSLLVWTWLDVIFFKKPSVIGAVQGMITGLVCITPGAGLVQGWAAIIMGVLSGSVPWFTMMIIHKRSKLLQKVDDTLGVFHTHAVAGLLGGILTGIFAEPQLCNLFLPIVSSRGGVYGGTGGKQVLKQMVGGLFIIGWNLVVTTVICIVINLVIPLRMPEAELLIGDDAVHGEEAYALWGDGEKYDPSRHDIFLDDTSHINPSSTGTTQVV